MKMKALVAGALCMVMLCGCEVQTPGGTLNIQFDESKKSEQTKIIDSEGNETVVDDVSINLDTYMDALLGSVAWPQGTSAADFKAWAHGIVGDLNLDTVGIDDVEKSVSDALAALGLDPSKAENREKVEDAVKEALESSGVDTTDLDIGELVGGIIDEESK